MEPPTEPSMEGVVAATLIYAEFFFGRGLDD